VSSRAASLALAWAACCLAGTPLLAQPPAAPGEKQATPAELYREAKDLIREGRFDVAAERLKAFVAANPTEKDFLDLQRADPTTFLKLRNVAVWSDEPKAHAEAVKVVEQIIARAEEANKKTYHDPARIDRFTRNLGATLEERIFAEQQLRLAGEAAVPVMVEQLRTSSDVVLRAGILGAITRLGVETVPGFLAATDGFSDDLKLGILQAVAARPDVLALLSAAETDFVPHLWYYSAERGEEGRALRAFATATLEKLAGSGASRRRPEAELVAIADRFARRTARFHNPDKVRLWAWDPATLNVTPADATRSQAEEFYALKYLRWALDIRPNDTAAQELFLTVAVERGVERARFRDLAESDPVLFQLLVAAPSDMLNGLLDQALREQRTALAFGLTALLAIRADKTAAAGPAPGKPGVFVKALDYPDPRVQLAAAIGLLKAPSPASHGRQGRVVEILRRAAAVEPAAPGAKEMGRALIADPGDARSEKMATFLRQLGYVTERLQTGRELLRRVSRAADYDLVVIDRHIGDPELADLLAQARADANVARRPVLVVASADAPRPVPLDHMLLRLALLVAVTDTPAAPVPPPFSFDPSRVLTDESAQRAETRRVRDQRLLNIYDVRLARLARLVDAAGIPQSRELAARYELRLPQLTYAALAAEHPVSPESAPEVAKRYQAQNALVLNHPEMARAIQVPTEGLGRLIEQLEAALDPARRERFERMRAHIDPKPLGMSDDTTRDRDTERKLERLLRAYPRVKITTEPYGLTGLAEDIQAAAADPAELPRDPATRRRDAKIAVEWLRRIAVGEIPGYDVRPAEPALRQALRDDELADDAIDAVGRISSAEAQQDLLFVTLSAGRPVPLRLKSGDRTIQHIQSFGRLTPANQVASLEKAADAETNNELKARMRTIHQLLVGRPEDLGRVMSKYPLPIPQPPEAKAKEPAPAPEPGKEVKMPEPGKN
jgi:CheY-like chemotaxis protein